MAFPAHILSVINSIRRGIDVALQNNCLGSSVILILSAVDTMAYVSMPQAQQDVTRTDFMNWTDRYIRFPGTEQLTRADLYGARCAMLHSYGVRSRMSRQGDCRMVGYMDESSPPIRFDPKVSKELVLVSIPALKEALYQGMEQFLNDFYGQPETAKLADERFNTIVGQFPVDDL